MDAVDDAHTPQHPVIRAWKRRTAMMATAMVMYNENIEFFCAKRYKNTTLVQF
jgi:hypothetical protein